MRLTVLEYDEMIKGLLDDFHRRVAEMGPPPVGFRYVLGEPQFWSKDDEIEVTIPIELERI